MHFMLPLSHDEVVYGKKISSGQNATGRMAKIRKFGFYTHTCLHIPVLNSFLWK
jgi:1,4-alpha-glucan branching enzyme